MYRCVSGVDVFNNLSSAERLQRLIWRQAWATVPSWRDRGPSTRRGTVSRDGL